jgi:hypothetical protein
LHTKLELLELDEDELLEDELDELLSELELELELELESEELDELLSELELELGATPPHVVCVTVKLPPSSVLQHE